MLHYALLYHPLLYYTIPSLASFSWHTHLVQEGGFFRSSHYTIPYCAIKLSYYSTPNCTLFYKRKECNGFGLQVPLHHITLITLRHILSYRRVEGGIPILHYAASYRIVFCAILSFTKAEVASPFLPRRWVWLPRPHSIALYLSIIFL